MQNNERCLLNTKTIDQIPLLSDENTHFVDLVSTNDKKGAFAPFFIIM